MRTRQMRLFLNLLSCMVYVYGGVSSDRELGGSLSDREAPNPHIAPSRACLANQLRCTSGQCIPYKYNCDGKADCDDESDEIDCFNKCSWNQFKCTTSSKCISKLEVCNLVDDCVDGSDEKYCSCGLKPKSSKIKFVVGGSKTDAGDWPWMASLVETYDAGTASHICGGTLITDSHVLTAAHCFDMFTKEELKVRLAEYNFTSTKDAKHTDFRIADIKKHEKYNETTIENDIAIVRLAHPATFTKIISCVCLPPAVDDFANKTGIILGWGRDHYLSFLNGVLQELLITVWNQSECISAYKDHPDDIITPHMLCVGDKRRRLGSCKGDSGGPLLIEIDNMWYITGIISWGVKCAYDYKPTVLTRVNHYLPWILEYTNSWTCSDDDEFQCKGSRHCIPIEAVCDGKSDCFDNSDEENCDACIGFQEKNNTCTSYYSTEHNCTCHDGYKAINTHDICLGCIKDECISCLAESNTVCDESRIPPVCTCAENHLPVDGDARNGCKDPCLDFNEANAVCDRVDHVTRRCSCNAGFHPVRNDACNGCNVCPLSLGYKNYRDFGCLKEHKTSKNWDDARSSCISEGGDLFSPGDKLPLLPQDEMNLQNYCWIGARRNGNGPYERVNSGQKLEDDSKIWSSNYPTRGSRECVGYSISSGLLFDRICTTSLFYFICQIKF